MNLGLEIYRDGTVNSSGVGVIDCDGIRLDVSREFQDLDGENYVLLDCHGGDAAYRFSLTVEKAEALAALLLHAAKNLR